MQFLWAVWIWPFPKRELVALGRARSAADKCLEDRLTKESNHLLDLQGRHRGTSWAELALHGTEQKIRTKVNSNQA